MGTFHSSRCRIPSALLSTILSTPVLPAADVERTLNERALQPAGIPLEVPVDGFRDVMERSLRDAIEATKP